VRVGTVEQTQQSKLKPPKIKSTAVPERSPNMSFLPLTGEVKTVMFEKKLEELIITARQFLDQQSKFLYYKDARKKREGTEKRLVRQRKLYGKFIRDELTLYKKGLDMTLVINPEYREGRNKKKQNKKQAARKICR
jgi:hypothetical protein